jgi:hypothetical protein
MEKQILQLTFFYKIVTNAFVLCGESTFVCIRVHVINSQKYCERRGVSTVPLLRSSASILNWNMLLLTVPTMFSFVKFFKGDDEKR